MRIRALALFASPLLLSALTIAPAGAQAVADASPAPPAPAAAPWCEVDVRSVDPLDPALGAATTFLVNLSPPYPGVGTTASGTVALFTRDDRYNIAFHDADVRKHQGPGYAGTVLAVHFPAPVHLEGAYVSELTAPAAHECAPSSPLMLTLEYPAALGPQAARGPASVVDIIAPAPILDPMPECSVPYAEPRTLRISRLQLPEIVAENGDDQIAGVRVRLAPNGSVVSVTVVEPSHLPAFDEAVVHAAQHSTYAPGIFRCAAVGGEYKFVGAAQPR